MILDNGVFYSDQKASKSALDFEAFHIYENQSKLHHIPLTFTHCFP
ncbi:conserved hypothetical protein [Vibrio chagasii]|nr:conserved hypothetical protein [Vibrio chagasii]CAH7291721.1 conserved hypothetical protein [Vibrio chagasii]